MKPIKMLGLAMLAALTAMAFVGASSATAEPTQLCKEDTAVLVGGVYVETGKCPEGQAVTHVHEETLTREKGVLLNSLETPVLCNVLFLSTVGTGVLGLGEPQIIHGHFTYSECIRDLKEGTQACTVTEVSADSLIEVLREGHELGKVTGKGEVHVECGLLINCTYKGEKLVGHGLGPLLPGTLEKLGGVLIDNQTTVKVKGLCPEIAELDLTTTPLEDVYIAK